MSNCITIAIDSTELQKIVDAAVEASMREVLTLGQY